MEYGEAAIAMGREGVAAVTDDLRLRLALERALYLVGEAANALPEEVRAGIDQPWADVIGLRHVLAHRYEALDPLRLVLIATQDLPPLVRAARRHLDRKAA